MTFPLVPLPPEVLALWSGFARLHEFAGVALGGALVLIGPIVLVAVVIGNWTEQSLGQTPNELASWRKYARLGLGIFLAGLFLLATGAIFLVPLLLVGVLALLVRGTQLAFGK